MFEYKVRALLNLSQDAQRQATVNFIGSISGASKPATDRLLLESAPTQARSLEGRPLAMYASLRLPDRSRLRLSNPRQRSAPHPANRSDPLSAPLSSLAQEKEGGMRPIATELERWKNERL